MINDFRQNYGPLALMQTYIDRTTKEVAFQ